ncbi:hypothetical protein ykris0001_7220 [Yersinia kristensenii ATCC 33638]|nr:hypothetical protein ykris0001_7220 [Yersinia kristensenii ATCC 33638]
MPNIIAEAIKITLRQRKIKLSGGKWIFSQVGLLRRRI